MHGLQLNMKFLLIVLASIALSTVKAISLIPGDNSHYVEGKSRYIWMPDGDGKPHIVDLQAQPDTTLLSSRDGANNQYFLFTRQNANEPQLISYGDNNSIKNSNYRSDLPTKVLVHGWNGHANIGMNTLLSSTFLEVQDVNVIVVDWSDAANRLYTTSVRSVASVGQHLGDFLQWLIGNTSGDWSRVHLIGFSLGAHVVGNAGRRVNGQPSRITGLDPAGPLWSRNSNALDSSAGVHVESIHTDGGILGILEPISHVDFYPNGGKNRQPGCWVSTCSHNRAWELFASSIINDRFVGKECSNIDEATNKKCNGRRLFNMGNSRLSKSGFGLYGLSTKGTWPF